MNDKGSTEGSIPTDTKTILLENYRRFLRLREIADKANTSPHYSQLIEYFKNHPKRNPLDSLADVYEKFHEFEPDPKYEYLKDSIFKLMQLCEQQYLAARTVLKATIDLHIQENKINEPLGVYWGAGRDRFVDQLGQVWWKNIGEYSERNSEFTHSHWNVAANSTSPPLIKGIPSAVNYNVFDTKLPSMIPAESVDIGLLKTVGGILLVKEVGNAFWDKIIKTMKPGGLFISTDPIPEAVVPLFKPYQPMLSVIGSNEIKLNANMAYRKLLDGYTSDIFSCYSFVGRAKK
jgi:hypothetical protein